MNSYWGGAGGALFVALAFMLYLIWTKPDCRDGYVATVLPFNGWGCVPGYKP